MVFESDPSNILATLDTVESRAGAAAQAVEVSAGRIESAIGKSFDGATSKTNKYYKNLIDRDKTASAQIRSSLEKTRRAHEAAFESSFRGAKGIDSKFGIIGEKIESATGGVRRFQGAISGTIGVAAGLIGVIAIWGNKIKENRQQLKEFSDALDSSIKQSKEALQGEVFKSANLGALSSELSEANKQRISEEKQILDGLDKIIEKRNSFFGVLGAFISEPDTIAQNNKIFSDADKALKDIEKNYIRRANIIRANNAEREEGDRKALENAGRLAAESQRIANIEDPAAKEDAIHEKRMQNIAEQFGAIKESNAELYAEIEEEENKRHRNALANIEERLAAERDAAEKRRLAEEEAEARAEAAHQRELQRIAEQAERVRVENRKIINDAASGLKSSFGEETTRLLETIVKRIDRVNRSARRGG